MVEIHLKKHPYTYNLATKEVRISFKKTLGFLFPTGKHFGFNDNVFLVNKIYVVIKNEINLIKDGWLYVTFAFVKDIKEPSIFDMPHSDIFERVFEKITKGVAESLDEYLFKKHNLPHKVFFNDKKKATTLLYGDEVTVVKACKGDKYDKEKGFLMAFFQKQSGLSKTQAKKYLKKIIEQE